MAAHSSSQKSDKLIRDHNTLREAVLNATLNWASLENQLAVLLETTLGAGRGFGLAIYYAANNAETRFMVVDRALWIALNNDNDGRSLHCEWTHVKKKLDKVRNVRNKIIHGNITTVYSMGKNRIRLTPQIFDMTRMADNYKKRQIPGMSPNDVSAAADGILSASKRISLVKEGVTAYYAGDATTLHEKCHELSKHRSP